MIFLSMIFLEIREGRRRNWIGPEISCRALSLSLSSSSLCYFGQARNYHDKAPNCHRPSRAKQRAPLKHRVDAAYGGACGAATTRLIAGDVRTESAL